ncbi:MAG: chemotaxis protein [Thermodesulfovibrionales bacterium]|nr:chemotaxis protein [Thermodesulfovibrionales bacterium]
MATQLEEIEKRSRLALSNQMEMLIFYLSDRQLYGINVFKIIEILECPKNMTRLPLAHEAIVGTVDFRGRAINVIDLGFVLGLAKLDYANQLCYIVVCDYSNNINGFLIVHPDSLITRGWDEIKSPSGLLTKSAYLTAISYNDNNETIQILDVEKILSEIVGISDEVTEGLINIDEGNTLTDLEVLVVDDSKTARQLMKHVLDQIGVKSTLMDSAENALSFLREISQGRQTARFGLIISDIEMPGIDGFTFVRRLREDPNIAHHKVILHSSLSNPSNKEKAMLVGADDFVAKFQPNILAKKVVEILSSANR